MARLRVVLDTELRQDGAEVREVRRLRRRACQPFRRGFAKASERVAPRALPRLRVE
jgi:hypothetical protein